MRRKVLRSQIVAAASAVCLWTGSSLATDFTNVQPAALDQPRINAYLSLSADSAPLSFEGTFNIQAFYDTGASGVLLSTNTAGMLGIQPSTFNNQEVIFRDVGVAGADEFFVSGPVHIGLAPYHPEADVDNPPTYQSVYSQVFGPVRTQIGPANQTDPNPLLADLDVFGTPVMAGKVVVMDPKPVDTFLDTMRTYVYNPGTPFNSAQANTNPGIPTVDRHIKLSYGNFERFTEVVPAGAPGPTMANNPFIGPNPVLALQNDPPPDNTPKVKLSYANQSTEGSFLLDTGAAASIISTNMASSLGVTYVPGTKGTDNPQLDGVPMDDQFTLTVGGIGGTSKVAGFFLDSMLLRTQEGVATNDDDPNHIRFLRAPVLVSDITLKDPLTQQPLTLDGIFGMNYLVASAYVTETGSSGGFPVIGEMTFGHFNWAVFDQPGGTLGLSLKPDVPPQQGLSWFGGLFTENVWNTSDANFIDAQSGSFASFQNGDHVNFTDMTVDSDVRITEPVAPGSITINNSVDAPYKFRGQPIEGLTGLNKSGAGKVTFINSNAYKGITDIAEGTMDFVASQDLGPVNVRPAGQLIMENNQRLRELNIDGGYARLTPFDKLLVVEKLQIVNSGTLELEDNAAVIHSSASTREAAYFHVRDAARSARNGAAGRWKGPGLTSTFAAGNDNTGLVILLNDDGSGKELMPTFHGEAVDVNSILIQYSWNGDVNLDGRINADDYFRIDSGFLAHPANPMYRDGDFNYDGKINADDYFMIDSAFLGQTGPLSAPLSAVLAPEPGTFGLIGAGALFLLRRSRRSA